MCNYLHIRRTFVLSIELRHMYFFEMEVGFFANQVGKALQANKELLYPT